MELITNFKVDILAKRSCRRKYSLPKEIKREPLNIPVIKPVHFVKIYMTLPDIKDKMYVSECDVTDFMFNQFPNCSIVSVQLNSKKDCCIFEILDFSRLQPFTKQCVQLPIKMESIDRPDGLMNIIKPVDNMYEQLKSIQINNYLFPKRFIKSQINVSEDGLNFEFKARKEYQY